MIILGVPFTGKSFKAKAIVRSAGRVLFFDPCGDYTEVALPITLDELAAAPEILLGELLALAVQPEGATPAELAAELEATVRLARLAKNLVLVLDEVGDYSREAESTLTRLARNGRHDGIATVFVSQAAVDIPKTVRRMATRVFSFLQTDPDDLAALEKRCGTAFVQRVTTWRRGDPPAEWTIPSMEH